MASNIDTSSYTSCLLCYKDADPLHLLGEFIPKYSCHLLCLRFASGLENKKSFPKEKDFIKEVNRAKKFKCKYCSKRRASLGCADETCKATYHLGCAKEKDTISFHDTFASFCDKHRVLQIDDDSSVEFKGEKPCNICGQKTKLKDALTSPCCKKINHKTCIQVEASKGKQSCHTCGKSTKTFIQDMFYYGIYFKNYGNERDFIKAGQTLPSSIIRKLLEQKTRESAPKKLIKSNNTKIKTEVAEIKTEGFESKTHGQEIKTETVEITPKQVETEETEKISLMPAIEENEIMEASENKGELVETSVKEIDSCSKESKTEAVDTKMTKSDIEETKENSASDEQEMMESCEAEKMDEEVNSTQYGVEKLQNIAVNEKERKETEIPMEKSVIAAKAALDLAIAIEKVAEEYYIIMILLTGALYYNEAMKPHMKAHLDYYKNYIKIRIRKGFRPGEKLEDCLKKTTLEECLKAAVDKKLMKIKMEEEDVEYYIDDSLVINGEKIEKSSVRDSTTKSLQDLRDTTTARIEAEKLCKLVENML